MTRRAQAISGTVLRRRREVLGWSKAQLAQYAGVCTATVNRLELGLGGQYLKETAVRKALVDFSNYIRRTAPALTREVAEGRRLDFPTFVEGPGPRS